MGYFWLQVIRMLTLNPKPHLIDWGFPKIGGTFWRPRIRIILYWGLYWGNLVLGNYQLPKQSYSLFDLQSYVCYTSNKFKSASNLYPHAQASQDL